MLLYVGVRSFTLTKPKLALNSDNNLFVGVDTSESGNPIAWALELKNVR